MWRYSQTPSGRVTEMHTAFFFFKMLLVSAPQPVNILFPGLKKQW